MGAVQAWLKQLVLVALLAALVEMLLPQSGLRRYAHAALGLLVLLAVLVPFLALVRQGVDWEAALGPGPEPAAAPARRVEATVRRLEEVNLRQALAAYRRQVEEAVAAAAAEVPGVARATAGARVEEDPGRPRFGTVTAVTVTVTPAPEARGAPGRLREAVAEAVARRFGWERARVQVVVVMGRDEG